MFGMESRFSFVSTAGFAFFFGKANTVKPPLQIIRVAHAFRVLAMTSRHRALLGKDCFGVTPKVRAGPA